MGNGYQIAIAREPPHGHHRPDTSAVVQFRETDLLNIIVLPSIAASHGAGNIAIDFFFPFGSLSRLFEFLSAVFRVQMELGAD